MLNLKNCFSIKNKLIISNKCNYLFQVLLFFFALAIVSNSIGYSMQIINNDGLLTDINGEALNKTIKMKFSILNDNKSIVWKRERFVTVKNGIFSIRLGSKIPINTKFINKNNLLNVVMKIDDDYKEVGLAYRLNSANKILSKFVYIDIVSTIKARIINASAHDNNLLDNSSNYSRDIPNICDTAFSKGIRDHFYLLIEQEQFYLYQTMLCNERFSSYQEYKEKMTSLGLSINTSDVVIGLNGSQDNKESTFKENYQKFCSSDYYNEDFHSRYASKIEQINTELVKSWKECSLRYLDAWMELNKKGLYIDITPFANFSQFLVTVTRNSVYTTSNTIESFGTNRSECFRGTERIIPGETKINQNEFTMVCSKNPTQEIPFLIETQEGFSNMVTVPKESGRVNELLTEIDRLHSQTNELWNTIYEIENRVQKISNGGSGSGLAPDTIVCKKYTELFGSTGGHFISFSHSDCGGVLPDNTYIGVAKVININCGMSNFIVKDAPKPGVEVWALNPNGSTGVEVLYIKVK